MGIPEWFSTMSPHERSLAGLPKQNPGGTVLRESSCVLQKQRASCVCVVSGPGFAFYPQALSCS